MKFYTAYYQMLQQSKSSQSELISLRPLSHVADHRFPHSTFYQMNQKPFLYYLKYYQQDTQISFYNQLVSFGPPIVPFKHISNPLDSPSNCLGSAFTNNCSQNSLYFPYHNFTLEQLINLLQNQKLSLSQSEILYIITTLIKLASNYQQTYQKPCGIFQTRSIFLTIEKIVKIYPIHFNYPFQHNATMETINLTPMKSSNPSNKHLHSTNESTISLDSCIVNSDIQDIFIIALQLITHKHYHYYRHIKHQQPIQDQINSALQHKSYFTHLSAPFCQLLQLVLKQRVMKQLSQISRYIDEMIENENIKIHRTLKLEPMHQDNIQDDKNIKNRHGILQKISTKKLILSKLQR